MQVILFCLAIGRDPTGLKIAIVNGELKDNQTCYSVLKMMNDNRTMMNGNETDECFSLNMACKYLQFLDTEKMIQVHIV